MVRRRSILTLPLALAAGPAAAAGEVLRTAAQADDIRALGSEGFILATRATGCHSFLAEQPGLTVDAGAADDERNLRKLLSGRGRFFYHADATLRHVIEATGMQARVRILPAVLRADQQLLAHARGLAPERLARVVAAMRAVELNGAAARLRVAYGLL